MENEVEIMIRLDELETKVNELLGAPPPEVVEVPDYVVGEKELSDIKLFGVFASLLATYKHIAGTGLSAFLEAVSVVLAEVGAHLVDPWAGLFAKLSTVVYLKAAEMEDDFMADVDWGGLLGSWVTLAHKFEDEPDREHLLTFGEFLRVIAAGLGDSDFRTPLFYHRSPRMIGGPRKYETAGAVFSNLMGVAFSLGRWFGCGRAPKWSFDTTDPLVDPSTLPYSVA